MSVAVSCNLSDGVIMGVDSAVTVPASGGGVAKVYEDAEKLHQLCDRPIGVANFGLGSLGGRSIGSYIWEFTLSPPGKEISEETYELEDVARKLRTFFMKKYKEILVPVVEKNQKKKFDQIPLQNLPGFGLVIGGFSDRKYLSEVWLLHIPGKKRLGEVKRLRSRGQFGSDWIAMFEPIRRYFKGYDKALIDELTSYCESLRKSPFSGVEKKKIQEIIARYEYQVPFAAMPMQKGVELTRFLIDLVINHYAFATGAPVVGGRARIGKVTYGGKVFEILDN